MAWQDYIDTVEKIYIAYYQRPADPLGLIYWAQRLDLSGGDLTEIIDAFANSEEAQALYGDITEDTIGDVVDAIYQAAFNRAPDEEGKNFYVNGFKEGKFTAGAIALDILNGAQDDDAIVLQNKLESALNFTKAIDPELDGKELLATYEGDDDAQAGRDFLKEVGVTADTVKDSSDAVEYIQEKIADSGDPIEEETAGKTFTLTVGEDSGVDFVGTSANDTYNAPAVQNNVGALTDTLDSVDILDGGDGTDTLSATIASGNPAPVLKNIENVYLRFAADNSVDLTSATGVTAIKVENSTDTGTVNGVGAVENLIVANQLKDVVFDNSTASTLALNLDTVGDFTTPTQIVVDLGATTAHKATTLNITANDANAEVKDTKGVNVTTTLTVDATGTNSLKLTEAAKATSVTVTGTGYADLSGAAFTGALTKFDASANEGGVKADIQSTKAVVVTTGSGDDVIDMDTTVQNDSSVSLGAGDDTLYTGALLASFTKGVDGGDGTDIINITNGAVLNATTSKYITNFETLDVSGGKGNYDVSLNSFVTVQIDEAIAGALAGDVDFKNAPDTFTLTIASKEKTDADFDVTKTITVTGKDYTGTTAKGDAETFTLVANINDGNKDNAADGNIDAQTVTVDDVENINVIANVTTLDGGTDALEASKHTLTVDFVADDAETLTIQGDASVDLSGVPTIGKVTKVDASGSTGNITVDFSMHAKSVSYIGSDGVDTYSAGIAGDTIYTGKGADVVTLDPNPGVAGAVRDVFVLKAATDSQITDTNKDGKITLEFDTGFDKISNFDSVGDPTPVANTSDRLDLTNFNFSGAERGVVDVSAKVDNSTDLTSIADLFNDPAGDRGVAYTVFGGNSYVFIDANHDGDFTAADDLVIELVGVVAVSESMINF